MQSTVWNELLEFETSDLLKERIANHTGRKPSANKISQITSNFIQGREYFRSAHSADTTVRPLLLYYGIMALSKGLILSVNPLLKEESLTSSHGLSVKNWRDIIGSKKYEHLELTVTNGTFYDLVTETRNKSYLKANSSKIKWDVFPRPPALDDTITLGNIVKSFPDLDREIKSWTGENVTYAAVEAMTQKAGDTRLEFRLRGHLDMDIIDLIFPKIYCKNRLCSFPSSSTVVIYDLETAPWYPHITQKWSGPLNIGDACVVPSLPGGTGLNLLSSMYSISYVFGMMVRYFPTTWVSLRRQTSGDRVYPFIHSCLDFIQEKYPVQILDFLNFYRIRPLEEVNSSN